MLLKPRNPGTFSGAISGLMEDIGYGALVSELEISKSQLFRFSDEDEPQLPRIDVAYRIDRLAARNGLGTPLYTVYGAKLAEAGRPAHKPQDPLDAVTNTIREVSEAVGAYRAAQIKPSPASVAAGLREIAEAERELVSLRRDLESMLAEGKPPLRMVGPERGEMEAGNEAAGQGAATPDPACVQQQSRSHPNG